MSSASPMFTNHPICDSIRSSAVTNCVSSNGKGDFLESRVQSVGCSTRQRKLQSKCLTLMNNIDSISHNCNSTIVYSIGSLFHLHLNRSKLSRIAGIATCQD